MKFSIMSLILKKKILYKAMKFFQRMILTSKNSFTAMSKNQLKIKSWLLIQDQQIFWLIIIDYNNVNYGGAPGVMVMEVPLM